MSNEKNIFWKDMASLREDYIYYNQFNFTSNLGYAISKIISKYENEDYVCSLVNVEKINGFRRIKDSRKKKYKRFMTFFVICKKEDFRNLVNIGFSNRKTAFEFFNSTCQHCSIYNGIVNPDELVERFPYLEPLFYFLNEWRFSNGLACIPDEVILEKLEMILRDNYTLKLVN